MTQHGRTQPARLVAITLLLLAACGSSATSEDESAVNAGAQPTAEGSDLERILLTPEDLGPEYRVDQSITAGVNEFIDNAFTRCTRPDAALVSTANVVDRAESALRRDDRSAIYSAVVLAQTEEDAVTALDTLASDPFLDCLRSVAESYSDPSEGILYSDVVTSRTDISVASVEEVVSLEIRATLSFQSGPSFPNDVSLIFLRRDGRIGYIYVLSSDQTTQPSTLQALASVVGERMSG